MSQGRDEPVVSVRELADEVRMGKGELMTIKVRERERLSQEAYDQVFGPFDRGEFRELTDQEWKALVDGQRKSLHDPQSFALPPKGLDR